MNDDTLLLAPDPTNEDDEIALYLCQGSRGGFAQRVAEAWCCADSTNKKRLKAAFPHYFTGRITTDMKLERLRLMSEGDALRWYVTHVKADDPDAEQLREYLLARI